MSRILLCLFTIAFLSSGTGALAKPADNQADAKMGTVLERGGLLSTLSLNSSRGPVEITAEALDFDYRKLELTYRGQVKVKQGDMTLQADRLRVLLQEGSDQMVREISAEGGVRIAQGDRVATGGRAVFDQESRTVTLSKSAVLRQGTNEVAGEKVTVYLDEQRSVVQGGVRARLYPGEEKAAKGEKSEKLGTDNGS